MKKSNNSPLKKVGVAMRLDNNPSNVIGQVGPEQTNPIPAMFNVYISTIIFVIKLIHFHRTACYPQVANSWYKRN